MERANRARSQCMAAMRPTHVDVARVMHMVRLTVNPAIPTTHIHCTQSSCVRHEPAAPCEFFYPQVGVGVGPSSGGGPSRPQMTRKFASQFREYGFFSCCVSGAGGMGASICRARNMVVWLDSGHKTRHRAGAGRISGLIRLHHCDGPRFRYPPRRAHGQGHPR